MGELYLQQGHREDALRVYRALLTERPGDARLAAKIHDLEAPARSPRVSKPPHESATAFLRRVWRAEPASELTGALEAAFAGAPRASRAMPQAAESPGAPTQPAEDAISLDAVFGDQVGRSGPDPAPSAPPPETEPGRRSGGFSFDDFFGAAPGAPGATARSPRGGSRPNRPQPEDEDLDQFQAWLKGLKT
jgi:hypothetical protein